MQRKDKFFSLFQKIKKFVIERKGYCLLAVILVVLLAVFIANADIETVSEHNEKQSIVAGERESILELLQQDTTGKTTTKEQTTESTTTQESSESESTTIQESSGILTNTQESSESERATTWESSESENTTKPTDRVYDTTLQMSSEVLTTTQTQTSSREENTTQTSSQEENTTQEKNTPTTTEESEYIAVSILISCEKAIGHKDLKEEVSLPKQGVFLDTKTVVKKGETVFEALQNACADNQISCVSQNSSYGAYVSAIGGLAEKDCGKYSGWKYKVNGVVGTKACSNYVLKENDEILWYYAPSVND